MLRHAQRKLRAKRLDLILAQQVPPPKRLVRGQANGHGAPFGRRRVRAWLLARDGSVTKLGMITKPRVARVLLDKIEGLCYGQSIHGL